MRMKMEKRLKQGQEQDLRIATLNVGTMTGRGNEIWDMMERRKLLVLCVQETKWKGSKARKIGNGYKLYYSGTTNNRNGVGIILHSSLTAGVISVERCSDRIMRIQIEVCGVIVHVISAYAPQTGCEEEEKEKFWEDLDDCVSKLPGAERVYIGADLNGHVGEDNAGNERNVGKHGLGTRNEQGERIVCFAESFDLAIVNTFFKKSLEQKVTYKSGQNSTQIDYVLCRRRMLKEVKDCKVMASECVTPQHRPVVCHLKLRTPIQQDKKVEPKIKWWRLNVPEVAERFKIEVREKVGEVLQVTWKATADGIRSVASEVLGKSTGRLKKRRKPGGGRKRCRKV